MLSRSGSFGHSARRAAQHAGKIPLHFYLELPIRIAEILRRGGLRGAAESLLWRVHCASPYNGPLGERLATMLYEHHQHCYALGSIERGEFIMRVLDRSFLSPQLASAYFRNLEELLRKRERRASPGQIVLGLGAGRCGSTTLAGILHSIDGAVSTHENPPTIFWEPLRRQIEFHVRRFHAFCQYFPLVADCAHWWINVLDDIFDQLPGSKAVGLHRDIDPCVRSWMKVSPADINHWVSPYSGIWRDDKWDPLYPHYDLPEGARRSPAKAKEDLVRRYVVEYNDRLRQIAARMPDRVLLLRTEELDIPSTRRRISEFVGLPVGTSKVHLNRGTDADRPSADGFYF